MTDVAVTTPTRRRRLSGWTGVLLVCLTLLALLFLTPTVGVILSALKSTRDIAFGTLWAIPRTLDLFLVLYNPARGRRIGSPGSGSGERKKR